MAGYALTGLPKRHAAQLIGPHDAGKSTTLKLFGLTWGDYAGTLASSNLAKNTHKGGDVGRPDLWRVRGKRLVTVAEVDPAERLDVALFKTITSGGDAQQLRTFFDKSGGGDVVFKFALWMSGNKPYGPPPDEEASFARLDVLDCLHVVAEGDRTTKEEEDLFTLPEVRDAVLAFAVEGFQRLYGDKSGKLVAPASSQARKQTLINELDPWSRVIDELFEVTGNLDDGVLKTEAWTSVRFELDMNRNSYKAQAAFEASLIRRGAVLAHNSARAGGDRYWQGVRWAPDVERRYKITRLDWSNG
jgi:phage/plasmid-associated DNA primase